MRRVSITVAPELDDAMRDAAERENKTISAWIGEAIGEKLERHKQDREARLREFDEWFGPIDPEIARQADEEMLRLGILKPEDLE
jgi:predicted transcriptional regulator